MKISTEEELVKEAYRLSKEIEDLAAYKPGKEEVAKRIERIIEKLKERKMTLSPPLTKYILWDIAYGLTGKIFAGSNMITKLNSYILTDRVKDAMRNKLYKTQQEELGFTLCSKSDNIITPGRDLIGDSRKIEIDPGACKEDEKFLGGYHTHHETDSRASAEDLYHCGKFKIICTGGKTDNKIRCHTWKYEQLSSEDIGKMTDIVKKDVTNFESLKYQQSFNCFDTIGLLYSREKNVKENMDKKIYDIKSFLSILKKSGATESVTRVQNMLTIATKARNTYANKLVEEIKNESKKYYNEVEIK